MSESYPEITLPDGGEWATAPLLHPDNVGKYVVSVFNGNVKHAHTSPVVKIGRTNVHVGRYGKPDSLRVSGNGHTATGDRNGYMVSCHTHEWLSIRELRNNMVDRIRRASLGDIPLHDLDEIVTIIERNQPT